MSPKEMMALLTYDLTGWTVEFLPLESLGAAGTNRTAAKDILLDLLRDPLVSGATKKEAIASTRKRVADFLAKARRLLVRIDVISCPIHLVALLHAKVMFASTLLNALERKGLKSYDFAVAKSIMMSYQGAEAGKDLDVLKNLALRLRRPPTRSTQESQESRLRRSLRPLARLDEIFIVASIVLVDAEPSSCSFLIPKFVGPTLIKLHDRPSNLKWVRVCLVQPRFSVRRSSPSRSFGYGPQELELMFRKTVSALNIARSEKAHIVCFPELGFSSTWVKSIAAEYRDLIIVGGSYYRQRYNTCPVFVGGRVYEVRKIHPAPNVEDEVEEGQGMARGDHIAVFETMFGTFAVLICIDYLEENHHLFHNRNDTPVPLDFIINPCFNSDVVRFQREAEQDCQRPDFPFILQINSLQLGAKDSGGTCIVGTDHAKAIARYRHAGYARQGDPARYKLAEVEGEGIVVATLNVADKGIRLPSSGPKMRDVHMYVCSEGGWTIRNVRSRRA
jgi:hypothetical protein